MNLTVTDIKIVMRGIAETLGLTNVVFPEEIPLGEISEERTVIATSKESMGKIWASCIVTMSVLVPDVGSGIANLSRIHSLEQSLLPEFREGMVGSRTGNDYSVTLQDISVEADAKLRCHYVCIKLMFEILNTKI